MKKFLCYKKSKKILFIFIWILLWAGASSVINNNVILPGPSEVFFNIIDVVLDNDFKNIIISTFMRVLLSFIISIILSLIIAALSSTYTIIGDFITPVISVIKAIPTMALVIILLIWADKEITPYITSIVISFPIIYENIMDSIRNADKDIINMSNIFNVSIFRKVLDIYVPLILFGLHGIFSSILSLIFKVVIAGEIYGQPKYGIGVSLQQEKIYFNMTSILSWVVIVTVINYIFTVASKIAGERLYIWKK